MASNTYLHGPLGNRGHSGFNQGRSGTTRSNLKSQTSLMGYGLTIHRKSDRKEYVRYCIRHCIRHGYFLQYNGIMYAKILYQGKHQHSGLLTELLPCYNENRKNNKRLLL